MRIKRILMFVIVLIVLIVGVKLISIKGKQEVEVRTETEIETDISQDEELLNILTNDEPIPSDGSITMTGIFRKKIEKNN